MNHEKNHIVPFSLHLWVWVGLLVLTLLTVSSVLVDLKNFVVFAALLIATLKASIVAIYFMHLKFDKKILSMMLGLVMLVFIAFIVLTFVDYSFR
ncbi:MAG TPA: cytochrome C oxidase subunit IV family protein [Bacteroidia bacterium]|nr:cytochrome C oxidase subunit IV family protein [Bacteroidia bacterium]